MRVVTKNLPSRRAQVEISLKMEPLYSNLDEDERHRLAALVFAQHDAVIACWPDAHGIDGYAVGILKGGEYTENGYAGTLRITQFPCLPSEIEAQNLSALYGDDRIERRCDLESYIRRVCGNLSSEALSIAQSYFERYDRFYQDTTLQ